MLKELIVNQKKIKYFDGRFFKVKDTEFEITATDITGPGALDAVHRIKNTATKESRDLPMAKLVHILTNSAAT